MKTPAYAKAKAITSISGANATQKHITTLRRAQKLLFAQGDEESYRAYVALNLTISAYKSQLAVFYKSEHYLSHWTVSAKV